MYQTRSRADEALLNTIYQIASRGYCMTSVLAEKATGHLKALLVRRADEYQQVEEEAMEGLRRLGYEPEAEESTRDVIGSLAYITSDADVAGAMIRGGADGMTSLRGTLNASRDAAAQIQTLAARTIQEEQRNIERMKAFLG
ncbi:hypothetical protein LJC32_06025 [Oscillospiraceae bacterium OttesenSCG-928-F05]|nr:hypothetical protein [Oscillospiraceae bacterium OttesenSCG-928-F05]